MKRTTMLIDYRKCMKCGHTTKNISENTCKCGGYMYMIGGVYVPKVRHTTKI